MTDVAGLGTTSWTITIALVARRTGAYGEAGAWWRKKVLSSEEQRNRLQKVLTRFPLEASMIVQTNASVYFFTWMRGAGG